MRKTKFMRGFKRLLSVVLVLWFGSWAVVIMNGLLSEQHYKLHVWHSKSADNSFTIPGLTLVDSDGYGALSGPIYRSVEDVTISGRRYVLFFRSDDPDLKSRSSEYVKALPTKDIEEIERTSSFSWKFELVDHLKFALGIPVALAALGLLLFFLYRGFRPAELVD